MLVSHRLTVCDIESILKGCLHHHPNRDKVYRILKDLSSELALEKEKESCSHTTHCRNRNNPHNHILSQDYISQIRKARSPEALKSDLPRVYELIQSLKREGLDRCERLCLVTAVSSKTGQKYFQNKENYDL